LFEGIRNRTAVKPGENKFKNFLPPGRTWIILLFLVLSQNVFSQISTATGGNWSDPNTWVGNAVPVAGGNVVIADGATVTIDENTASLNSLTIGQGASGVLIFEAVTARTVTVAGNVTIASGGIFQSANSGTITNHTLIVSGDLINNGTLNFSTAANRGALINFTGPLFATFNCSGNTLTNLRQNEGGMAWVTLDKGTSFATFLEFTPGTNGTFQVLGGNTAGFLSITNGTFRIVGNNTFSNPVFNVASYDILRTCGIWLNNPNATIVGQNGTVSLRSGLIRLTLGTYNIGTSSGNSLEYSAPTTAPQIIIEGPSLNVAGRICVLTAGASIVNYSQIGGTVTVVTQGSASGTVAGFDISAAGSSFTMSGGSIVIQRQSSFTSDYLNLASTNNVIGGTIQIGNGSTPIAQNFRINSSVPTYNFIISGGNTPSVTLVANDLTINGQLTLNGGNLDAATNGRTVIVTNNLTTSVSRTSGHVIGNLRRAVATGSLTYNFPIGTTADYTPVSIQFNNVTTGGNLTGLATNGDHPSLGTSTLDANRSVNTNWRFTNGGLSFTSFNASFNYNLIDPSPTNPLSFSVGNYNGTAWSYPSANLPTSNTATTIIGVTTFGDFAIANCTPQVFNVSGGGTVCLGDPVNIFLSGSEVGVEYNLLNTLGQTFGSPIAGTGFSLNFGPIVLSPGVYIVEAVNQTTGCSGLMNGSATVTILPTPATPNIFVASGSPTFCAGGNITLSTTSLEPNFQWNLNGIPLTNNAIYSGVNTNTLTISNAAPAQSGSYTVTVNNGSCSATSTTLTVTVTPNNTVSTASASPTLCINTAISPAITHTTTGATGIANNGVPGVNGLPAGVSATWASNTITIIGTPTAAGTFNYSIPLTGGCGTVNATGTITVTPDNTVSAASSSPTLCINTAISPAITHTTTGATGIGAPVNLPAGVTATWNANTITISGTPTAAGTFNYSIPLTGGCGTVNATGTITVNPTPTVTNPSTATICSGSSTNITLTSSVPSTFTWTIGTITGAITGASAGSGGTINQTLSNPSNTTAGTVQYIITPTSTTGSCVGNPFTITVTVNPRPAVTNASTTTICSGSSINITLTSSVPSSFTWTIGTITGGITGASAGSGGTINQTLTNPSNTTAGTVQYIITPTSTTGSCVGNPFTITVTVTPGPTVTNSSTATICSGASINITLTSSVPSTFTWTIGTITGGITGASAGSGGTINQTLTNPSNTTAGTVQYIITPTSTTGSCVGNPFTITVTVNPRPAVTNPPTATICSGSSTNITLTSSVPSTFTWTIGTITGGITGASPGSGGTINQTLTNSSNTTAGTVQYIITPTSTTGSCVGNPFTITVTVNPRPAVTNVPTATICSGSSTNITLTSSVPGTFTWTIGTITGGITGASAGSGGTINQILTNPSNTTAGTVQYIITPTSTTGSCVGNPFTITVTVNPRPAVTTAATKTICSGTSTNITLTSSVPGTFTWTIGTITGGITGASAGSGGTINQILTNPSNTTSGTVQYIVTPTSTTGSCVGNPFTITVTVNPLPAVAITANYCYGNGFVQLTANVTPAGTYTYLWSNGATTQNVLVDLAGTYSVTVTNSVTGCQGTAFTNVAQELVTNGTFSAGNVGFTSAYGYVADVAGNAELVPEGLYGVGTNPQNYHNNFWGIDHTTGTGNFMIVNGSPSAGANIWTQTVTVLPNTVYYFSAWAMSLNNVPPFAQLQFSVNGGPIGTTAVLAAGVNNNGNNGWVRFYGSWNSGAATTAVITIINLQTALGGNDFGLDDISFGTLSPVSFSANPNANAGGAVCIGGTLTLSANITGGTSPFIYSWSGPNGFTSTLANPTVTTNATSANSGSYTLSVTDAYGCPVTATFSVIVNAPPVVANQTTAVCSGIAFNVTPAGAPAGTTYTWAAPTGTGFTGGSAQGTGQTSISQTLTNTTTNPVTATYIVTPITTGCAGNTFTLTVTVNPSPTIVINPSSPSICIGSSVILTASGANTYSWSPATGLSSTTGGTVTANPGVTTTYTVTGTNTVTGCINTATVTVTVNSLPVINSVTATPSAICIGSSSNLSVSIANNAATIVNYNFNSGTSYGTLTPTLASGISSSLTGSSVFGTVAGTATGLNAFTANVTGNALTANINNTWTFMLGGANLPNYTTFRVYFQVQRTGGGTNTVAISYSYNGGAYTSTGVTSTAIAGTTYASASSVSLGSNATWYEAIFSLPAAANNPTSLGIRLSIGNSGSATVYLDNFQVQAVATSPILYSWIGSPAATAGLPANAGTPLSTNNNISVSPTATTTYTLTATDANGCTSTANTTVTVNMPPTLNGVTICQGGSGTLTSPTTCPTGSPVTSGPNFAGAGATGGGAGDGWSNPGNITFNDNQVALSDINNISEALNATSFGFAIPANATILGVQVTIGREAQNSNSLQDNSVRLIVGGAAAGNNYASAIYWPTTETAISYGSTTDLWGIALTPAQVNAANFGVALVVENDNNNNREAEVDYIQIAITYTVPGTVNWYTVATGGTVVQAGSPFNPVADPEVIAAGGIYANLTNTNTPGTYTFYAECSSFPGCRAPVNFIINPTPTAFNVTGTGSYCVGGTGLPVGLSGSQTGVNYQLFIGATPVGTPVAGTGSAISFGLQTAAGTYTVIATNTTTNCTASMNGSAIVTINPKPITAPITHN
jgi:hypothetical protein